MKKIFVITIIMLTIAFSFSNPALAEDLSGYIGTSIFPVNDEHDTNGTVEGYAEYARKNFFVSAEGEFWITNNVPKKTRTDNSYITGTSFGTFGYLSDVQLGIGYKLPKGFDIRLIYRNQRWYTGYEGDSTGIQVRWNFGKN